MLSTCTHCTTNCFPCIRVFSRETTGIIVFCIVHTFASMILFPQFPLCRMLAAVSIVLQYTNNLHNPTTVLSDIYIHTTSTKCKGQGTRCKGQGTRCKGHDQHQCKLVRDAATTFNYHHHHHHRPGPTQHNAAISATCVRVCRVPLCKLQ